MPPKKSSGSRDVESLRHKEAKRRHIPTAELEGFVEEQEKAPQTIRWPRNTDLDPQLVWRGKDSAEDLAVEAVPIYIQEKIKPEVIIQDLKRRSNAARRERAEADEGFIPDMFADFNGLPEKEAELEFYEHDKNWSNRMILGDALLVMTSLAEKEAMKGRIQCVYLDPPYGIKFNSNWQPSTKSRTVSEGGVDSMTREPEMIRAFRDTWKDGINSYLTYLRDRLIVARDLLHESGSIFVQIGDENVHLVRGLIDEVFGGDNFVSLMTIQKTGGQPTGLISNTADYVIWYRKDQNAVKYRPIFQKKIAGEGAGSGARYDRLDDEGRAFQTTSLTSSKPPGSFEVHFQGRIFTPGGRFWTTGEQGIHRLANAARIEAGPKTIRFVRYLEDFPAYQITNVWDDVAGAGEKIYVVQTSPKVIERCILMTTDPGDLVLDPTCGSGTTAYVSEQWGRRWITIDTSRVALALARQRLMAARFLAYLLQDSSEGARKEGELAGKPPKDGPFSRSVRQGFVYERVPHIALKSIANNAEIDIIWETWQVTLGPLLDKLNEGLEQAWEEWEVPREATKDWPAKAKDLHAKWWEARHARQKAIDESISRNADIEYLVDQPYEDRNKVRVTGPFSVESLSPHRVLPADEDDTNPVIEGLNSERSEVGAAPIPPRTKSARREDVRRGEEDFVRVVLDNLFKAGVQNTKKGEKLIFTELKPWPGGRLIAAEGRYREGEGERAKERRVAITIDPEYGTVSYGMVRDAAREAIDGVFDTLVVCGFAFDPHVTDERLSRFGALTVLRARMNNDLHMAEHLRSTGAGNLFVVFGEPDITTHKDRDGHVRVEILGVDIFDPTTGEVRSSSVDDIACWFVDTDYNGESFFVRQAYFLGGNDPYKRLKTTLKAEVDEEAWSTLYSAVSRPFDKPSTGKIAVKVINHYGDEVLKVFAIG